MTRMRHLTAFVLSASLVAAPVAAQDDSSDLRDGMDLLGEGTKLLLRGLMNEIEPQLEELSGVLDNLNAYHAPEVLPNGDIIIRRKVPLNVEPEEGGDIEL